MLQIQAEHTANPAGFGTLPAVHHPFVGGGEDASALIAVLDCLTGQIVAFQRTIGLVFLLSVRVMDLGVQDLEAWDFYFCLFLTCLQTS